MPGGKKKYGRDKASIKFKGVPLDVVDLPDICKEGDISKPIESSKRSCKQSELLSTAHVVSVIGKIWDSANRPLPVFRSKENVVENENAVCYTSWEGSNTFAAKVLDFNVDPKCAKGYYNMVNSSFQYTDMSKKSVSLECDGRLSSRSRFWKYVQFDESNRLVGRWKVYGIANSAISFDIENLRENTAGVSSRPNYPLAESENESRSKTSLSTNVAIGFTNSCTSVIKSEESTSGKTLEPLQSTEQPNTSLPPDNSLEPATCIKEIAAVSSSVDSEYHCSPQDQDNCAIEKDENMLEKKSMCNAEEHVLVNVPAKEFCSVGRDEPKSVFQNQRHAIAGALSGTFVSLCLHPVDTIKTVIQSGSLAEKSIFDVIKSVISDRGVTGLYRGIATNIASSAPISAVYTYTYETVKGAMLPILPKEYHSIAHCTAGGCASIATSFLFTPSERIKQQMQVSSQYQNCWAALVGILGRGGLSSLYAGWSAVLCRNIPHSIIKFYTYETLKQLLLPSTQPNSRPSTCQTLICGGLAGSTAALFTTPFDVVKTRLQTQIPGSLYKYNGVLHALQEISRQEGLKGLYRGLTPRLVMYISQGALFFASYEMFKSIFQFEVPQIYTPPAFQEKHDIKGEKFHNT
ncbi:hypothetical protein ACHQM5_000675 [Ranunculus cassubicifolius]